MRGPNIQEGRVERSKLVTYLLNREHPDGRSKAFFFERFGFRIDEWQHMTQALRNQAAQHPVTSITRSAHGVRYVVDGPIETPDGRNPVIRTVWIRESGAVTPRLITAYPQSA